MHERSSSSSSSRRPERATHSLAGQQNRRNRAGAAAVALRYRRTPALNDRCSRCLLVQRTTIERWNVEPAGNRHRLSHRPDSGGVSLAHCRSYVNSGVACRAWQVNANQCKSMQIMANHVRWRRGRPPATLWLHVRRWLAAMLRWCGTLGLTRALLGDPARPAQ